MNTPAAGWYPDPAGQPDTVRWWDGSAWTHALAADETAPQPDAGVDGAATGGAQQQAGGAVGTVVAEAPANSGDASTRQATDGRRIYPPGYEPRQPPARRKKGSLTRTVIGTAVMIVAAALVLVIVTHQRAGNEQLSPPPPLPSAEQSSGTSDVYYDDNSRELTLPGLTVTMPGSPYLVLDVDQALPGSIDKGALGTAVVHQNYQGSQDWIATVSAGVVNDSMIDKDLNGTADAIYDKFVKDSFVGEPVQLKKQTKETLTTGLPHPARVINAQAHYHVKGLPSSYDKISVMVVDLGDGSYSAWVSSRPNDSGPKVNNALQDSIKTVQVTS